MESCVSKVGLKPHNTLSVNDRAAFVSLERKQLATATIFSRKGSTETKGETTRSKDMGVGQC